MKCDCQYFVLLVFPTSSLVPQVVLQLGKDDSTLFYYFLALYTTNFSQNYGYTKQKKTRFHYNQNLCLFYSYQ